MPRPHPISSIPDAGSSSPRFGAPAGILGSHRRTLGLDSILHQLKQANLVSGLSAVQLISLPRNPLRADFHTRADFRVERNGRPLFHLSIGRNLKNLRSRAVALNKACPRITTKPLFWHRLDDWDYFGSEFVAGDSIQSLLTSGRIQPGRVEAALESLMAGLNETARSSSTKALIDELRTLFEEVQSLPIFGDTDRVFLEGVVFPFVQNGISTVAPRTRWTNGDLTAGNILITETGEPKLIDAEFARRTHFFATDAWRWQRFSQLPPELTTPRVFLNEYQSEPWFQALCLLQQLVFLYEIHPPSIAREEAQAGVSELAALTSQAHARFRGESLLPSVLSASEQVQPPLTTPRPFAQLFWAPDGNFSELRSGSVELNPGSECSLKFELNIAPGPMRLRFDPCNNAGVIEISSIRVRRSARPEVIYSANESAGWIDLSFSDDLFRLPSGTNLTLLSLGDDPSVFLPEFIVDAQTGFVVVEIWMNFHPGLRRLRNYLPDMLLAPLAPPLPIEEGSDTVPVSSDPMPSHMERPAQEGNAAQPVHSHSVDTREPAGEFEAANRTDDDTNETAARAQEELAALKERLFQAEQEISSNEQALALAREQIWRQDELIRSLESDLSNRAGTPESTDGPSSSAVDIPTIGMTEETRLFLEQERDAALLRESEIRQQLGEARENLARLTARCEQLEAEITASNGRAQSLSEQNRADAELIASLEAELAEKKSLENVVAELKNQTDKDAEMIADLRKKTEALDTLSASLEKLQTAHEAVLLELSEARDKLELAQRQGMEATNSSAQILREKATYIETLENAHNAIRAELDQLRQQQAQDAQIIANLRAELQRKENVAIPLAAARAALAQATKKNNDLAGDLQLKEQTLQEALVRENAARAECDATHSHVAHLNHTIHLLHGDLRSAHGEMEKLHRHIAHLNHELGRERATIQEIQEQASRETERIRATAGEQVSVLEARLRALEEESQRLSERQARMTRSFSWRITAPLRFLRRQLID